MMVSKSGLVIVLVLFSICYTEGKRKLAPFIEPCKKDDPELSKCAKDHANAAIIGVLKGNEELGYPSLNPYKIENMNLTLGQTLHLKFHDLLLGGYNNVTATDFQIDLERKHWRIEILADRGEAIADCDIDGKILIMPVVGNGRCNVTLGNPHFIYDYDYELVKKGNVEYIKTKNAVMKSDIQQSYTKLTDVIKGNDVIEKEINRFLNENWREIYEEFKPSIEGIYSQLFTNILELYISRVPYSEIFV